MPEKIQLSPRDRIAIKAERRLYDAKVAGAIAVGLVLAFPIVDLPYELTESQFSYNINYSYGKAFDLSVLLAVGNFAVHKYHKKGLRKLRG